MAVELLAVLKCMRLR